MKKRIVDRHHAVAAVLLATLAISVSPHRASAASLLTLGPKGIQTLVADQLFSKSGRWYLIDDGGVCFTYLQSPRTHLEADRLVLNARLTSRLGQRVGDSCIGADFASNVTLSGKLRATDSKLLLDDIRIDRVEDEATRGALTLALQIAPDALPRSAGIDVLELLRKQLVENSGLPIRVQQFHILNLTTRPDGVNIQVDVSLSTP
jgi:hypothetical protein